LILFKESITAVALGCSLFVFDSCCAQIGYSVWPYFKEANQVADWLPNDAFDLDVSTHSLPQPPADCLLGCNWLGGSTYFMYLAGLSRWRILVGFLFPRYCLVSFCFLAFPLNKKKNKTNTVNSFYSNISCETMSRFKLDSNNVWRTYLF